MKNAILKALSIEQGEEASVTLLVFQSFFLGVFFGAFDIAANSLFLDAFDSSELAKGFMVSGFVGIIITSIYSWGQSIFKFSKLSLINLFAILFITVLLWLGLRMHTGKALPFATLVLLGPLRVVGLVGFWGVAGRIFNLRQGKRLFSLVDSGYIIGIIISSFTIPLFINLGFATHDVLLISALSVLIAWAAQLVIGKRFKLNNESGTAPTHYKDEGSFLTMLSKRYTLLMSIFVFLSMVVAFFVSYAFLTTTAAQYPNNKQFAQFLGVFNGFMMIIALIIKTTVYGKLVKNYNLQVILLIVPFLLTLLSVMAIGIGHFMGYEATSPGFVLFFLMLAISRMFGNALRDAIEVPSFKILYQSLKKEIRHRIQARIDGTVNELSALTAGIFLFALGLLPWCKTIHYTYVLAGVLVVWVIVTVLLYRQYQVSLKQVLNKPNSPDPTASKTTQLDTLLQQAYQGNEATVIYLNSLTEAILPQHHDQFRTQLLLLGNDQSQNYIIANLEAEGAYQFRDTVKKVVNNTENQQLKLTGKRFLQQCQDFINTERSYDELSNLCRSTEKEKRAEVARYIWHHPDTKFEPIVVTLLRDHEHEVIAPAIKAAGVLQAEAILPLLVDYLGSRTFCRNAYSAIIAYGDKCVKVLEQSFYKTGTIEKNLADIVGILGNLGSEQAINCLLYQLNNTQENVVRATIKALYNCGFLASDDKLTRVKTAINQSCTALAWAYWALWHTQYTHTDVFLAEPLKQEKKRHTQELFMLLSLAYDASSVNTVKENLEAGSSESIGYGLELLEIFLGEDLKPVVMPLLDDLPLSEKVRNLQNDYPLGFVPKHDFLQTLLNQEYRIFSMWTKACTLTCMAESMPTELPQAIPALMFSPHRLLHELAGLITYRHNKAVFEDVCQRLPKHIAETLPDTIHDALNGRSPLLMDLIHLLLVSPALKDCNGNDVAEIAQYLAPVDTSNSPIYLESGRIAPLLWAANKGCLIKYANRIVELEVMQPATELLAQTGAAQLNCKAGSLIYQLERRRLDDLLFRNGSLAQSLQQLRP